ncbi:MAG TPA: hypothetical protein VFV37_01875 [Luteibaculaceae bacterium]|nr:hypothetical protein [Luteibaculaceae bacterium]
MKRVLWGVLLFTSLSSAQAQQQEFSDLLELYFGVVQAVADQKSESAAQQAAICVGSFKTFPQDILNERQRNIWQERVPQVMNYLGELGASTDAYHQQMALKEGSKHLIELVNQLDINHVELYVLCSSQAEACWLSRHAKGLNPFLQSGQKNDAKVTQTLAAH